MKEKLKIVENIDVLNASEIEVYIKTNMLPINISILKEIDMSM